MDPVLIWFATQVLAPEIAALGLQQLGKKDWRVKLAASKGVPRFRRRRVRRWLDRETTWEDLVSPSPDGIERLIASLASNLRPRFVVRRKRYLAARRRSDAERTVAAVVAQFIPSLDPSLATAVAHHQEVKLLTALADNQRDIRQLLEMDSQLPDRVRRLPPPLRPLIRELKELNAAEAVRVVQLLTDVPPRMSRCDRVAELVQSPFDWIHHGHAQLWLILGEYAATYGCGEYAAVAFERAVEAGASDQPRWLARAALSVADGNPTRARQLLTRARELMALHPFVELTAAMMKGDLDAILSITASDGWVSDRNAGIAYVARARAQLARDDFQDAIQTCDLGIRVAPESSALVLEKARALIVRAQEPGAGNRESDLRAGRAKAQEAQIMRRDWGGDSAEALELACKSAIAAQDWETVLRIGRPAPDGEAQAEEAESQLVLPHVAAAAAVGGNRELASSLVDRVTDAFERTYLRGLLADDDAEALAAFEAAMALADSPEKKTEVQLGLAAQGKWPVPGLDETRARDEELADVIEAMAHARRGEIDDALPLLRKWSPTSLRASRLLVDTYQQADDTDKARDSALSAHARFGEERFLLDAVMVLARAGRWQEAEEQARHALEIVTAPGVKRKLRRAQMDMAARRGDWAHLESLARAAIEEGDENPSTGWALVGSTFNQLRPDEAWKALCRMPELSPNNEHEGRLWLDLNRRFNRTPEWADQALSLADRFAQSEEFLAAVIMALLALPKEVSLTEETVRKLHELTDRFFESFPESTLIERFPVGEIDELIEELRQRLEPGSAQINEIGSKVLNGQLPIGAIAAAAGRSYGEAVVRLCAVHLPLEVESSETQNQETDVASIAMEKGAVAEISALYVGCVLSNLWPLIRSSFDSLLLPISTFGDMTQARDSLALRSTSSISWSSTTARPIISDISEEEADQRARAADFMTVEASRLTLITHERFLHLTQLDVARFGPWLAPLDLAKERGLPLFSDDGFLRSVARSIGVPSFGTLAALRVLVDQGRVRTEQMRAASVELRRRHAVEMSLEPSEILEAVRLDEWKPSGVAFAMTRRSFWRDREQALRIYLQICRDALARDKELVPHWLYVATLGLTQGASPDGVAGIASTLLGGTAVEFARDPLVMKSFVEAVRQAARDQGGQDPFPGAVRHMFSILISGLPRDQVARFAMSLFSALDATDRHEALAIMLREEGSI